MTKFSGVFSWLILSLEVSRGAYAEITEETRCSSQSRVSPDKEQTKWHQRVSPEHRPVVRMASIGSYSPTVSIAIRKTSNLAPNTHHNESIQRHTLVRRSKGDKPSIPPTHSNPSRPISSRPSSPDPLRPTLSRPISPNPRLSRPVLSNPSSSRPNSPDPRSSKLGKGTQSKPVVTKLSAPRSGTPNPATSTDNPFTPMRNALRPVNFSPLTRNAKELAATPGSSFFHDPLGVIKPDPLSARKSPPGSPNTLQSFRGFESHSSPFEHSDRPSSSRPQPINSKVPVAEITPATLSDPSHERQTSRRQEQRHERMNLQRQDSIRSQALSEAANQQGPKPWQKTVGLAWDWAGNNPRKACAAGAVILGGCSSVIGAPMLAYGGAGLYKAVGVGFAMAGPALATSAGTTLAITSIGEYKEREAISEKRQEDKWNEFLEKSRLNKIPSMEQMSQAIKHSPSLDKLSSGVKSGGSIILDHLKELNIFKKPSADTPKRSSSRPFNKVSSFDSLSSSRLDSFTIPEYPDREIDATWSSPYPSGTSGTPGTSRNPRKWSAIPSKLFNKSQLPK